MRSSTETWRGAATDLRHLMGFRSRSVRRPRVAAVSLVMVVAMTVLMAVAPAWLSGIPADRLDLVEAALPAALAGFLLLGIGASMGGGGGRELLPREQAVIHPIGPLTEHLGALVLAPLNLAWLLQAWALLATTALTVGPHGLLGAQVVVLLWVVLATAAAQVVGWSVEGVRRTRHGVVVIRSVTGAAALALLAGQVAGRLDDLSAALPTARLADSLGGPRWPLVAALLLVLVVGAVAAGGVPARWALGLPPREELRVESGVHEARPAPTPRLLGADLALMRQLDRGSVWRSVGMRRGLIVLAAGPALVALGAGLSWDTVLILPGLGASGAALLYGVNAWCLDGRGTLWRESLPVAPSATFDARTLVTAECLVLVSGVPVLAGAIRNGLPERQVAIALVACWVVVVVQVLAIAMSWSVRRPYAVDLRSPRATPAPHAAMFGYALRLSLVTTVTGMLFVGASSVPIWWLPPAFAALFLLRSGLRLRRARRRWLDAPARAEIALTVSAG
ncbi:hypothetical protein [Nocardioides currus]|uniref:ABC-2 type transport system permease protein n=1 Tax=Nocardioides currus TaxID=2133958 RepID=A0A2R7YY60_9ACTN|nr:hypothetical protein [Nocardioides currus]PUA81330.1 hypothetical protein C7S10_09940 [Nocardioides currus]